MLQGIERRKCKRISGHFIVESPKRTHRVRRIIPGGWNVVIASNLSASGALFDYNRIIEIGELIDMRVYFPAYKTPINCIGKVIRIEGPDSAPVRSVAVTFVKIDKNEKKMIDKVAERAYLRHARLARV